MHTLDGAIFEWTIKSLRLGRFRLSFIFQNNGNDRDIPNIANRSHCKSLKNIGTIEEGGMQRSTRPDRYSLYDT